MENILNKIDREKLNLGDHIYAYRKLHSYSHHGIFIGGDRVIHFHRTREPIKWKREKPCNNCGLDPNNLQGVVKSCVDCFLKGHTLRRFQYGISYGRYLTNWPGTCTTGTPHPPQVAVNRAYALLNKTNGSFGDYNLFANNCESFAVYCKTEKHVSDQSSSAKFLFKGVVKVAVDRLLHDVSVHHGPEKHNKLRQRTDRWLLCTLEEITANLQKDQESHVQQLKNQDEGKHPSHPSGSSS